MQSHFRDIGELEEYARTPFVAFSIFFYYSSTLCLHYGKLKTSYPSDIASNL